MRTVKQLPAGTPIETDFTKFPDSTVVNETDLPNSGTPVVREIYGDILTNIYKLLRITGITANGNEDNELNGYQLVTALQNLPNALNDIEQQLNLIGTQFTVGLNLSLLPANYFLLCRSVESIVDGVIYTFAGSDNNPYPFTAVTPFSSGDEVLLIINPSGVRAYSLSAIGSEESADEVFTPFGIPLAFNDSAKVYYQSEGTLFSDLPESYDLQAPIRILESNGTTIVYEMMIIGGFVVCLTFNPTAVSYKIYKYALNNLTTPILMTLSGSAFAIGTDYQPFIYTDGVKLYISNNTGNNTDDYAFDIYTMNLSAGTLTYSGTVSLDTGFVKTTNAVINNNNLYNYVNGVLNKYSLANGALTYVNTFSAFVGVLFKLNDNIYYSNGEIGKLWTLN